MLALLLTWASPARSVTFKWDRADDGGGRYLFECEKISYDGLNSNAVFYFRTQKAFSWEDDEFAYEYDFRAAHPRVNIEYMSLEGTVLLVTADNVSHTVGTWSKTASKSSSVTFSNTDKTYGTLALTQVDDGHTLHLRFIPTPRYTNTVKRLMLRFSFTHTNKWNSGWMEYTKDIPLGSLFSADSPMPPLDVEWDDNGLILVKAKNVPDKRDNPNYFFQGYSFYIHSWYSSKYSSFSVHNDDVIFNTADSKNTPHGNGLMDVEYAFRPMYFGNWEYGSYTRPMDIKVIRSLNYIVGDERIVNHMPTQTVKVAPFTRPEVVSVAFDKWNKKNTITWTRRENTITSSGKSCDCRFDGKWYVIRYVKGNDAKDYKLIASLDGDATELTATDNDTELEYEQEYVYRVVFLPFMLVDKCKNKLTELPQQVDTHTIHDLWEEATVSTKLYMPIVLSQDRTYDKAVRLVWKYCVQPSGQNWVIEHSPAGENKWRVLDSSLNVDASKASASFDAEGSVCDFVDFRVKTTYAGKDFYSNVFTGNLPSGSYISEVKASTGIHENKVDVTWKVMRADTNNDIYYRVLRRPIGTETWTLLTDAIHGKASEYTYEDTRPLAGSYYEYTVEAYEAKCDEQLVKTDQVIAPGFSQARGTITGHISFGTGTAVEGARVNLIKSSADSEAGQSQFLSRYIEGEGEGLMWHANSDKYVNILNGSQAMTLQLWARPQTKDGDSQQLLRLAGALELGVKNVGGRMHLYAIDNSQGGTAARDFTNLVFNDFDFTHVAAAYIRGTWTFYVGTDTLLSATMPVASTTWNAITDKNASATLTIGGSNRISGQPFTGYVDDIRLWNRALTKGEVDANYTRILGGTEKGLTLYWPLDEGTNVVRYAFDVARQDGIDQLNHPTVGVNVWPHNVGPKLLALYGLTDSEGDYIIKGIPFQQGGTNYKLAPSLGRHEFSPNTRSMFVSPTSLTANNIDFEDVSSFPMEGHVYYAGTNIPAVGINFYIDGNLVTADGEVKTTDAEGRYSISVPIGKHYVEARLEGHTMTDKGRFPTSGTFNFDRAVSYDFSDSTLVNFVGRVGGGLRNDTLAVGFAESKNNIGIATVTLKLTNESLSFNCKSDHITSATTPRTWASDTTSIRSKAWTGTGDNARFITIRTDSLTGEFSAMLPPLRYITKSIVIDSDKDHTMEFTELPEIDLTNARKVLTDSLKQAVEGGDSVWNRYKYNTKMIRTFFAQPKLDMVQKGTPAGIFGNKSITYKIDTEGNTATVNDIWKLDSNGKVNYRFQYPIYQMGDKQRFAIRAYEAYTNRDNASKVVADTIPLNGQKLVIANEMSDQQSVICTVEDPSTGYKPGDIYNMVNNELTLDKDGRAELEWTAGAPNIVSPYTRHFGITMERRKRTYVMAGMDAVVLGILTTGNNFVTQGPDKVQFVLRDPPGAKSKTTLKIGSITTKTHYDTYMRYGDHSIVSNIIAGSNLELGAGLGLMIISGNKIKNQIDAGVEGHWQYNHVKDTATVKTTISSVSTSSNTPYVGANGDVFVGTSSNILVGTCRKLYLKKDDLTGEYSIVLEDALALGEEIATTFHYSAYELETVMIPKWKDLRKKYLKRVATKQEAEAFVNTGTKSVWLTWLNPKDADYGKEGTYKFVAPQNPTDNERDSVEICNIQIEKWEKVLSDNEEEKVKAMKSKSPTNFSIDGGSSRVMTERNEVVKFDETKTTHKVGAVLGEHFGFSYRGPVSFGVIMNFSSNVGGGGTDGDGIKTDNYTEWEYTFDDGNRDVDISVNQYDSDNHAHSKIFSVFGGQTYNPYEPQEFTHHYQPGTPLGNGTVQMEQPQLRIGIGNQLPAESVTINDIPAGQTANLVLYCSNMANSHQGVDFVYELLVKEVTDTTGLEILMDGVPATGRTVMIPQGETVKKGITIRQTDVSILDHVGIKLLLRSRYQPTIIYDEVTLNAHFKPSSSAIDLVIAEPVLNTTSQGSKLEVKLANFDRQFKNLKNIGIEYRFAGSTAWTDLHTWVTDSKDSTSTHFNVMPQKGDLYYAIDMSDNTGYPEGAYQFRAYTTTPYDKEMVHVYSDIVNVTKDMTRPRALFTPAPSDGILAYGSQLAIEFNEDIVPGYVSDKNVIVTAKLNSQRLTHETALQLQPFGDVPVTVNPVFLNGDFAMDFWLRWHDSGTVMQQGEYDPNFALNIDDAGHVVASIAGTKMTSKATLPKDEWIFFALNYKANAMTFDILAQYGTHNIELFKNRAITPTDVQAITYSGDNHIYLGGIHADIHALSLYNISHDVYEAAATKYQAKDNYVYGLANYWPMDEGHGEIAHDTRHTHDFSVSGQWTLDNVNYSVRIDSEDGLKADITHISTAPGDSYAIELWQKVTSADNEQTVFETATPTVDGDLLPASAKIRLRYDAAKNLVLDYGTKSQIVGAIEDFPDPYVWRHLALNVVRGQAASFYINGQRTAVIAEADVPQLQGTTLIIGKNDNLTYVDELRIWHATLSESRLQNNIYNTIDTADVYARGLVAYYPFEKTGTVNGVTTKVGTMENMAKTALSGKPETITSAGEFTAVQFAPPLKNAPEETRLVASPVASERKVVINLTGAGISPRDLEGTTLNVTVDQVRDLHGNTSLPIRWTAFVQQNTLKWAKDSVNIIKPYGDDYTFDVNIENKSGNTEYYVLNNMPGWLSLAGSETNDDVAPLHTKTLRFKVNPLTPIGTYDITIGLEGNNDIAEPLRIVMKVSGDTPDWAVDPTNYEHQMTIIGQVYIDGILMENSESIVGAFIGNECRGVASPEKVRGAAYVTLTIFGNDIKDFDQGKDITFRIWDASQGVAYTDAAMTMPGQTTAVEAIPFVHDDFIGDFDAPAIWHKSENVEQIVPVHRNWNWIALGVEPKLTYLDQIFQDLDSWQVIIKNQGTQAAWSNGTQWGGNLKVSPNTMYKMKVEQNASTKTELPQALSIIGKKVNASETPVTLRKGWNWIAYTPLTTMAIGEALAGANPQKGDRVKSQTGIAIYSGSTWEGNLKALESGRGYMYYNAAADQPLKQFVYPTPPQSRKPRRAPIMTDEPLKYFTPIDPYLYPDNMTMAVQLRMAGEVVDTCEVAVFIDDECRAATRADGGLYFLIISGQGSGQTLDIRTYLRGRIRTIDATQHFVADDNIGTPWEPYVIQLPEVITDIDDLPAHDTTDTWYNLQGIKLDRRPTRHGVYIHNGKKVSL